MPMHTYGMPMGMSMQSLRGDYGRPPNTTKQMMRPGDWICPNPSCRDIQFERNTACRQCGTKKPLMSRNKQMFKKGDWICPNPDCKDVQFERNTECRQCGTARPTPDASVGDREERSRSPPRRSL